MSEVTPVEYIGTKRVRGIPMTRAAYNVLRNWELPADENGDDDGYLVEYLDGGKANVQGYEGYISWSPKDVFERAYKEVIIPLSPTAPLEFVSSTREKQNVDAIKQKGQEFLDLLFSVGTSRELSLANTNIELAVMWAVKHVTK